MPRLTLAAALLLAGCADDKLRDVTGTVTHGGAPVPKGVVWFDPDPAHPGNPPQGYAYIEDGAFTTAGTGRGVKPGPYLVRVEGFDGKPGEELPLGKPLFTDFREKRDLAPDQLRLEIAVPKGGRAKP